MNWCVFMDKIYKVVSAGENFGNLVCVSCKKNLLVSFLDLLDTICAIGMFDFWPASTGDIFHESYPLSVETVV